jgi:Ca2+-binding RTX toxin-like protein
MAELYHQLWTAWAATGQGPFMHFGDVDAISKFGAWGLYQSIGDRNPRADLLVDLNAREKSWFGDGGGLRYQQGVIRLAAEAGETLLGTGKDDFLIGGPGADVIVPGTGQDAVAGGEGQDVLVLAGAPGDYKLTPGADATLWQLTGPALSLRLSGIETFRFAGGVTKTLADMQPG